MVKKKKSGLSSSTSVLLAYLVQPCVLRATSRPPAAEDFAAEATC